MTASSVVRSRIETVLKKKPVLYWHLWAFTVSDAMSRVLYESKPCHLSHWFQPP